MSSPANTTTTHAPSPPVPSVQELFRFATDAAKSGDRIRARTLFERAAERRPDIPQTWQWLAHLADSADDRLDYLRRAHQLDPANSQIRNGLVRALMESGIARAKGGAKRAARPLFNEATELDPRLESAWLWLASLADSARERKAHVARVLEINPHHQSALLWKAEIERLAPAVEPRDDATPIILVVDDSLTVRSLVDRTLSRRGCRVLQAENGAQARARLAETVPDVVFLDIELPDTDGYEICRSLKADPRTRGLPVLMLSGKSGQHDRERSRAAGAVEHLTKPFRPDDLTRALKRYLKLEHGAGRQDSS